MMQDKLQKYKLNNSANQIHTGELLQTYYDARRINKSALSRMLGRSTSTLGSYTKHSSIQTTILWEICHALQHNFFKDIAARLPETYTSNAPLNNKHEIRIAELEGHVKILQAEIAILLKAIHQSK